MDITDIVLINLDKDGLRLKDSKRELDKFGLKFRRIPGVYDEVPGRGFSEAMVNALMAIPNGGIIFEDDIELDDFYIPDLPDNWDMLYFGANLQEKTSRVNDQLVRVYGAWTTHAILYSEKAVQKILSVYEYETCGIYDDWLKRKFLRQNNCYMITPMIAYQRESFSNMIKQQASYRKGFDENYNKYVE